jgi:DNA-binding PadR family transcriptional regulator
MVLGLLNETPRHGYEIQKWLEESHTAIWADVLPGSIYHALQQLQKEGFVEVSETAQTGHRLRAVYAITDTGRGELKRLLREALQQPPHAFPTTLYTALTFLKELPRDEVLASIESLIPQVEQEIETWNYGEAMKSDLVSLPAYVQAMFANGREHLEADLRLLHHLQQLLSQP